MTSPGNIIPLPAPEQQPDKRWAKSKFANLRRYVPSGMFHCHATVKGRLIRKSLKTKSEIIAKAKLDKLLAKERERLAKKPAGEIICRDLFTSYLERIENNHDLKASSKKYRREAVGIIRSAWPELEDMPPQRVAQEDVSDFALKFRSKKTKRGKPYSATRYNAALETLRAVFQLGVEQGCVAENPIVFANRRKGTKGIARAKIVPKNWQLPSTAGFKELVARLDSLPSRLRASRVVRFLAYSGLRIGAARKVTPGDIDLKRNFLTKPPIKHTDVPQRLPMFAELRRVSEELLADYPGTGPLLPIANPRKALRNSCIECGIEPLTNHALRHLFSTRCLESGVDVPTVAEWRGDKDGGAMLLRTYAHVIDQHSQKMAKRVKF